MSNYETSITRVDATIVSCRDNPKPLIFFNPSPQMLDYILKNNPSPITLSGTNGLYDGEYNAIFDRSSFDEETGTYTATIDTEWKGYPKLGEAKIGVPNTSLATFTPPTKMFKSDATTTKEENNSQNNINNLILLSLGILILFVIFKK